MCVICSSACIQVCPAVTAVLTTFRSSSLHLDKAADQLRGRFINIILTVFSPNLFLYSLRWPYS
ncbi:hypothetical protein CS542_06800 [Pedobacter sp. IW39]|nr:hypothetical protein CS542_06800 [Pedobacter sp. IW39]